VTATARGGGTLHVVATPIGNLEDVSPRALRTLREVALIAAEDTRVTARLLARYGVRTPCRSFREQNAARAIPGLMERLAAGDDVALVCDAGTPGISDPGVALVEAAAEAGFCVSPIPGPSALAAAISVAALPGDGVRFVGFLPRSGRNRRERIAELAADRSCTVLYESPARLAATLRDLAGACGERRAVVMRELTKIHEEIARGTLIALAARFEGGTRGEIVVAVAGAPKAAPAAVGDDTLRLAVAEHLAAGMSARDASAAVAVALGVPRKRAYAAAVAAAGRRSSV
jgi:16S rRNA (cytidine1402-2'-O)-methyltransferase